VPWLIGIARHKLADHFRAIERENGDGVEVTLEDVVISVAREYEKLGLPITAGEFGRDWYAWLERPKPTHME